MRTFFTLLTLALLASPALAAPPAEETAAERGYRLLRTKPYLPPDFDEQDFENAWRHWEEPLRSQAAAATPAVRRQMAFSRYGLTPGPEADEKDSVLQYVEREDGGWSMNCFACHGGKVAGQVVPGLPNSRFALETLTAEVRLAKIAAQKRLARMDLAMFKMPLGGTNGTTNAAMFGVILLALRHPDLKFDADLPAPNLLHHDLDAPPWWHTKKKKNLYIDGFAAKSHRAIMQFLLVPENKRQDFARWEADFHDILAYIESIEPPAYPFEIDRPLAARGEQVFHQHCASCHGTYGKNETYPEKLVPIDEVSTDRLRLDALDRRARETYAASWFAFQGQNKTDLGPGGYVAPPLDGVWASAPYFHNGSVPTLWHVLHPDQRPAVWQRTEDGYDQERVGLEIETFDKLPPAANGFVARHRYYDTRQPGKSAAGHRFPDALSTEEKRAVLEYLKTL